MKWFLSMTTNDVVLRVSSFLSIYYNTFPLACEQVITVCECVKNQLTLCFLLLLLLDFPAILALFSRDESTQHETHSTVCANEKLVGQSGRHYLIERVLQSKEVPPVPCLSCNVGVQ